MIDTMIRGAVLGLATGDAMSSPSATHRVALLAPKRAARMRSLAEYADQQKQTTRPFPYTHAQPNWMLHPGPSDDLEWFTFTAEILLSKRDPFIAWADLAARRNEIHARNGTKIALKNLADGLLPPQSGHDNPHYFDDIALVRAAGIALVSKVGLEELLSQVRTDISYTHSEDGLWGAEAIATLIFALKGGASIGEGIAQAVDRLPSESWAKREVTRALELTSKSVRTLDRVMLLENDFVDRIYCYPYSSPETLGLLFSHLRHSEDPVDTFMAAYLHRRNTDSLPPLLGFLNGLVHGDQWMPPLRDEARILSGICIPALKGKDFLAL